MATISFLDQTEATFSAIAHEKLASVLNGPRRKDPGVKFIPAGTNEELLKLVLSHGGYGTIAMETMAEGAINGPLESFIKLLDDYSGHCPIGVLGAMPMPINFALMALPGVGINDLKVVLAHQKALGACEHNLRGLGVKIVPSNSNGKAAEEVAVSRSTDTAALAPKIAAQKYGLIVLNEAFEDQAATTTFFFLGPRGKRTPQVGEMNRALMVFRLKHQPGTLVDVLQPFKQEEINLFNIHRLYKGCGEYDFVIETECRRKQFESHARAIEKATKETTRQILFGPFEVIKA